MLKTVLRQAETDCAWPCPADMSPILHRMLQTRGVKSAEEAQRFLHPGREMLRDPFLLNDMGKAVEIIEDALAKGENICVYGDYDVDGVCASAILSLYLRERGAHCDVYLPSRHKEGYGLNADAVDEIAGTCRLLITVDCGITSFDLVERAKQRGMRVIVTDHHQPDEKLPDCPTVNPLLGGYPFGYLCGTGVTFQLVSALGGRDKAMEYVDLAALATIADIVPLRDENRAIAALGLKKIHVSARPGVRALIRVSNLEGREIAAGNVAFQMTPRLNASGRIGDAMRAYNLLTSTDADECAALAEELDRENTNRKNFENEAFRQAEDQLKSFVFSEHRLISVRGEDWNAGVIGLAASRLTEKYHYPCVALTRDGDCYIGSCRSIEGVDIHEALTHVGSLLERFGGHKMAAGLKVKAENLDRFLAELDAYLLSAYPWELWIPVAEYDAEIDGNELTEELVEQLQALAPTGCQNPGAVFLSRGTALDASAVGREKEHLRFTLKMDSGMRLPGIWFRHGSLAASCSGHAAMLYSPSVNEFMGQRNVQAEVKCLIPDAAAADGRAAERFAAFVLNACENADTDFRPAEASDEEVREVFSRSHMGSIILAADETSAEQALRLAPGADVLTGAFPEDRRLFSSVCVTPSGTLPPYKNVFYAGFPDFLCVSGRKIGSIPVSGLFSRVPDTDTLREIYKLARRASQQGTVYKSVPDASLSISRQLSVGAEEAALGVCVLRHMGLISFETAPRGVTVNRSDEKKHPAEDALYRRLTANGENYDRA